MKKIIIAAVVSVVSIFTLAGGEKPRSRFALDGYSGGMMLHTGYVDAARADMTGAPFGIGGALRLNFGRHLRVGGEGYVSTLTYGPNRSYATVGWGGLLVDCAWTLGRWKPFAGGTFGGGQEKNVDLLTEITSDQKVRQFDAEYRKFLFVCIAPFAGIEYSLTESLNLVMKADYIFNLSNRQPDFAKGVRIYLGFMFCH